MVRAALKTCTWPCASQPAMWRFITVSSEGTMSLSLAGEKAAIRMRRWASRGRAAGRVREAAGHECAAWAMASVIGGSVWGL
jgi:hypothetical protein